MRLALPRVSHFRCQAGFPNMLIGTHREGMRWSRELRHPSGQHRIGLNRGFANPAAITLNTREVIDPANGRTLRFASVKVIDTPPRPIPVVRIGGPVACPAGEGDCFGAVAERGTAGLLRIRRGVRVAVLDKHQTRWFAPITVTDIVIDGDRLLLAKGCLFRGTKWVRFAVVDTASGERLFEERHGEDRVVSDPRIVPGPGGKFLFYCRGAPAGRLVAIRYRIPRPHSP